MKYAINLNNHSYQGIVTMAKLAEMEYVVQKNTTELVLLIALMFNVEITFVNLQKVKALAQIAELVVPMTKLVNQMNNQECVGIVN
jgi:hypothetical protein